jgi:hypothetical protein
LMGFRIARFLHPHAVVGVEQCARCYLEDLL